MLLTPISYCCVFPSRTLGKKCTSLTRIEEAVEEDDRNAQIIDKKLVADSGEMDDRQAECDEMRELESNQKYRGNRKLDSVSEIRQRLD